MKYLCIYHGNCADGFGAAWAVNHALAAEDVEFHPGVYQNPPPDVTGKHVILVDFSYKPEVLQEIINKALSVLILDHHKTAIEDIRAHSFRVQIMDMSDWSGVVDWKRYQQNLLQDECENCGCILYAYFDLNRSGAGLAWDFFFPGEPRPKLIDHIEDRDLWRFAMPGTREIQAALFSYPYDFEVWDRLVNSFDFAGGSRLLDEGAAIERKHHKDIAELTKVVTRMMNIGGYIVPMANLPYTLTSDAGHLLCGEEHPFAGCYWDTPEGRVFSLRSRENGADVADIAKQYGGGGHKHASGFRIPFDQLGQFEA